MRLQGKKVLVTGAGGFIGSHLVEHLVGLGADVRALVHYNARNNWGNLEFAEPLVRDSVEVVLGDIQDPFAVHAAVSGCSAVFHLCSLIAIPYSYVAPQSYVATNVLGAVNVLQAARAEDVERVVHISTSECYGTAQRVPIDEEHPLQGQSPYSASKIGADKIAESFHRSFDVPVVTVRPFNTYGPRQSARAVIPTIITQALNGGPLRLGSLTPTRDFTYVEDTARGMATVGCADSAVGEVVNIGSGREISVGDLAKTIAELCNSDVETVTESARVRPRGSEVDRLVCDASKAKRLAGWEPTISLREGLRRSIEWMRSHMSQYKPDQYVV